jgi:hypothetical protein
MVGRNGLCAASGQCRVRGVDHGTQECPFRPVLSSRAACLSEVSIIGCRRGNSRLQLVVLSSDVPVLSLRLAWQDLDMLATRRSCAAHLVEKRPSDATRCYAARSSVHTGDRDGTDDAADGAACGCLGCRMVFVGCAALSCGRTSALVLCRQVVLATSDHVHLPAVASRCCRSVAVSVPLGGTCCAGNIVVVAVSYWERATGSRAVLRRDPGAGARLLQRILFPLLLRRGPLSVRGAARATLSRRKCILRHLQTSQSRRPHPGNAH